jgi:hypothetical protein
MPPRDGSPPEADRTGTVTAPPPETPPEADRTGTPTPPSEPLRPSESRWRIVGASVAGASHASRGEACQDAYRWVIRSDGVLIAAVSDGAGSAPRSAEGAAFAVRRAVAHIDAGLHDVREGRKKVDAETHMVGTSEANRDALRDLVASAFVDARRTLLEVARCESASADLYACTLACIVVGEDWMAAAQVGDATIVAQGLSDDLTVLVGPQRGEYANETAMLTSSGGPVPEVQVVACRARGVALLTDGLLRLAVDGATKRAHAPFFDPIFDWARRAEPGDAARTALQAFLGSDRVATRSDDDRTLLIGVRPSP